MEAARRARRQWPAREQVATHLRRGEGLAQRYDARGRWRGETVARTRVSGGATRRLGRRRPVCKGECTRAPRKRRTVATHHRKSGSGRGGNAAAILARRATLPIKALPLALTPPPTSAARGRPWPVPIPQGTRGLMTTQPHRASTLAMRTVAVAPGAGGGSLKRRPPHTRERCALDHGAGGSASRGLKTGSKREKRWWGWSGQPQERIRRRPERPMRRSRPRWGGEGKQSR